MRHKVDSMTMRHMVHSVSLYFLHLAPFLSGLNKCFVLNWLSAEKNGWKQIWFKTTSGCAYRFRQATLVHVLKACAPLPASTGVVHGPRGAGHPVTVVARMGRIVDTVSVVVVMVVAGVERKTPSWKHQIDTYRSLFCFFLFPSLQRENVFCFVRNRLGVGCRKQSSHSAPGDLSFLYTIVTTMQMCLLGDEASLRNKNLLGWRRRGVVVRRCQAESVAEQHVHLRADLVNGRLRAECGGVGAAVSLHP